MRPPPILRHALVLGGFALVFAALCVGGYRDESATVDEGVNLVAGIAPLRLHDYRFDSQHPPLARMWSALPLLWAEPLTLRTDTPAWTRIQKWEYAHQFLYRDNDGDPLLNQARFMTVLLGIALGVLTYCWAVELYGFWTAVAVLLLFATEPNLVAHSGLVTTDVAVSCFFVGALYFGWRTARELSPANVSAMAACFAAAQVTKYSALLLGPILALWFALKLRPAAEWSGRLASQGLSLRGRSATVLGLLVLLAGATYVALWAVYGFRYAPSPDGDWLFHWDQGRTVGQNAPQLAAVLRWVDQHHLLPNTSAQGFLLKMAETQGQESFLNGQYSPTGWWYYFPVAFVQKTPLVLLILFVVGLPLVARRRTLWNSEALLLLAVALYLAVAMLSKADVGVRYLLPLFPLVILIAGAPLDWLLRTGRPALRLGAGALLLGQGLEFLTAYPHPLTFFNVLAGGPSGGVEHLVDSNLDWGQDLKGLKRWMDQEHVDTLNLAYFGNADPDYYHLQCTYLLGSPFFARSRIGSPSLPGYVAVSATHLQGVYLGRDRGYYKALLERRPVAVIGNSIYVYWVETDWHQASPPASTVPSAP